LIRRRVNGLTFPDDEDCLNQFTKRSSEKGPDMTSLNWTLWRFSRAGLLFRPREFFSRWGVNDNNAGSLRVN
jgi:hypothetical protein